jgi:uncharacterized protein (DUF58 family)
MNEPTVRPDAAVLARLRSLELTARQIVEGHLSGQHRSPYHGFAVEFAQHREYVPGDDIRHVDWKVYGRSERFYLKQYEQDTNLVCWLAVDRSESMRYASAGMSKYELACQAAAALGWLVVQQSDSVGLAAFDAQVRHFLRPAGTPTHYKEVLRALAQGTGPERTSLGPVLHELSGRLRRRGLVLLFSDLFDDVPAVLAGLRHLRYERHDVVVFHTLDAAELDFPFEDATLFRGMEAEPDLLTDPRGVRQGYQAELRSYLSELERGCRALNAEYVRLRTDEPLGPALAGWLARRSHR